MLFSLQTFKDLTRFFPTSVYELNALVKRELKKIAVSVEALYNTTEFTFDTTFLAFDKAQKHIDVLLFLLHFYEITHPLKSIRISAHEHSNAIEDYSSKAFSNPFSLYKALTAYADSISVDTLSSVERFFIKESLHSWKNEGIYLSSSSKEHLSYLKGKIIENIASLEINVTQDTHMVHKVNNQLQGVAFNYIRYLNKAHDGCYALKLDAYILESSSYEPTRIDFWKMAVNRGYPANHKKLSEIIALRDNYARTLGYTSFAQLDIENQMAQTPEIVESFLDTIITRCKEVLPQQIEPLKVHLPSSVQLTPQGTIKPWDLFYIKNYYKTKILGIDDATLASYFPFEHVYDVLLSLLEELFGIQFRKITKSVPWDHTISVLEVSQDGALKGWIIVDPFFRANKYLSILEQPIIPPIKHRDGHTSLALTAIIAHFLTPLPSMPSLLNHVEVNSLFHEMGHALHTLLAAQEIPSFAGSKVKRDFAEMPSQFLEQFAWQPWVLKRLGAHYQTGQPIPDDLIKRMQLYHFFDSADLVLEQCYLSMLSLEYYKEGKYKDIFGIHKRFYKRLRPHLMFSNYDHSYAAFDHLGAYGAKYYSYLWARVFAYDVFTYVQEQAALDGTYTIVVRRYMQEIISKGGSENPWVLLKNFLGREPSLEAFFILTRL